MLELLPYVRCVAVWSGLRLNWQAAKRLNETRLVLAMYAGFYQVVNVEVDVRGAWIGFGKVVAQFANARA